MLNEHAAHRAPYLVEPVAAGWRVRRLNPNNGALEEALETVTHRRQEVATAYAEAAVALERYLASRDRDEDSAELFEAWRALDDRYELLAIELDDPPVATAGDPWAAAAEPLRTLH